jgi:hypothetical protein
LYVELRAAILEEPAIDLFRSTGLCECDATGRARSHGLELAAMSEFLRFGFAGSTEGQLRRGVDVLAAALGKLRTARP